MSFASAVALVLALLRAFPALEQLARTAVQERDREREREARRRLEEKNAAVDAAIDAPKS